MQITINMKPRLIFFVVACVLATLINSAFALGSGTSACGNILFKNGERLDSVRFEMPNNMDRQVKVIIGGEKRKIDTDSIDYIVLWHDKHPDMQFLFKPFYVEFVNIETGEDLGLAEAPIWLCCDQMENNASYWHQIGRPDFKKGKIRFNYNALHSYRSTRYVLKKDREHPCRIPDSTKDKKKWVKVYFNDDPEVIKKLEAGDYDYKDWGYKGVDIRRIVEDYNPAN